MGRMEFFTVFCGFLRLHKKTPAGKRRKTLPGIEAEPLKQLNSKKKQKGGRIDAVLIQHRFIRLLKDIGRNKLQFNWSFFIIFASAFFSLFYPAKQVLMPIL